MHRRTPGWELGESESWMGLVLPPEFTSNRNAGQEVEWFAPVYVGDRLSYQNRLVDIFAKQGRSGPIIFIKREREIRNQDGVLVMRVTATTARMPRSQFAPKPAGDD
jgi:3-methylfumaryl-CoA hydratase